MGQINGLDVTPEDAPSELIDQLRKLGFTPETHPYLIRDMQRALKEATAAAGVSMEDTLSVRFSFDRDGCTGAKVTKIERN